MSVRAVRCIVTGRVQGVCYRAATRERALALQLRGWVRNRADGSVELVAAGPAPSVARLIDWLWQGPPAAEVREVTCVDEDDPGLADFEIRRDG